MDQNNNQNRKRKIDEVDDNDFESDICEDDDDSIDKTINKNLTINWYHPMHHYLLTHPEESQNSIITINQLLMRFNIFVKEIMNLCFIQNPTFLCEDYIINNTTIDEFVLLNDNKEYPLLSIFNYTGITDDTIKNYFKGLINILKKCVISRGNECDRDAIIFQILLFNRMQKENLQVQTNVIYPNLMDHSNANISMLKMKKIFKNPVSYELIKIALIKDNE